MRIAFFAIQELVIILRELFNTITNALLTQKPNLPDVIVDLSIGIRIYKGISANLVTYYGQGL